MLATAGPAQAAEKEWFPPVTIAADYLISPQAAVNRDGAAFVTFAAIPPASEMAATYRQPGSDFIPPVRVPWLRGGTGGINLVQSTYDSASRLVLAWRDPDNSFRYAMHDPATARWSFDTLVSSERRPTGLPAVQADDRGTVYAAWLQQPDSSGSCCDGPYVAKMSNGQGFGAPQQVAGRIGNMEGRVVLDVSSTGAAATVWPDSGARGYMTSVQPVGGSFGPPEQIPGASVGVTAGVPQVSVDDAGAALFALKSVESRGAMQEPATHIVVTTRRPDGTFTSPETISTTQDTSDPVIAAGPSGEAVVAWAEGERENARLLASVRGPDGSFSEPVMLAAGGAWRIAPQLGMDAAGNALVTWAAEDSMGWQIYAAHRAPFGGFGPPRSISLGAVQTGGDGYPDPRLFVGGPGNAIVAWFDIAGGRETARVDAAVFDVAPPRVLEFDAAAAGGGAVTSSARRHRLTFRWQVSEQSRVTIKLRRDGRTVRTLRRRARPGENTLKVRRRQLAEGRYRAVLRAKDRLGHRSKPRRDRFRLQAR